MAIGFKTVGNEFLVNTYETNTQRHPSITALDNGGYAIVWESSGRDTDGYGISGQLYDANGTVYQGEFQVNTYVTSNQQKPVITTLSNGNFAVIWQSFGEDAQYYGVFGQVYASNGSKVGSQFQVNTVEAFSQYNPTVTGLSGGGFVVVWNSDLQDGGALGIYGQHYDNNGAAIGDEFLVNNTTALSQGDPSVTALDDGGYLIAWETDGQDADGQSVYARRYDSSGTATGTEFQLNLTETGNQTNPVITGLNGGGFIVTWESYGQDSSGSGVYGQIYDSSGNVAKSEFLINTTVIDDQNGAHVAALPDGGFIVVWGSYDQDGDEGGVYGQRFDANGGTVGGETLINTNIDNEQTAPSVAVLSDGSFVVTWHSYASDDGGGSDGIYAQTFDARLYGSSSADTISDTVGANWIDGRRGDDFLFGNDGRDKIDGGGGDDNIAGGGQQDRILGGNGMDVIYGNGGNDVLKGGKGSDTIIGGNGKDIIVGGNGIDYLTGGVGADIFVYKKASDSIADTGADVIWDFEVGTDKIDLFDLGFLNYIGTNAFSGFGREFRIEEISGDTVVTFDLNGNGLAEMEILLMNVSGISVSDFDLIIPA